GTVGAAVRPVLTHLVMDDRPPGAEAAAVPAERSEDGGVMLTVPVGGHMGGREGQRPDILSLDIAGGLVRARPDRLLREHGKRFELGQAGEANPDGRSGAQ